MTEKNFNGALIFISTLCDVLIATGKNFSVTCLEDGMYELVIDEEL